MSVFLYRACLRAYPRTFRERYADDMASVFAARMHRARERSLARAVVLAAFCAADALVSGARERFARPTVLPAPRSSSMNPHSWLADARLAWRVIHRTPIISGAAIVTIALGLGASGAIFAAVDHVLLQPLPYVDPGRLVMVWSNNTREGQDRNPVSPADSLDLRRESQSFVDLQPMLSFLVSDQYLDGQHPDSVRSFSVAPGMFRLLGRTAVLGRTFDESPQAAAAHEVILSYDFWQRRYGGTPDVIGRQVTISGAPNYTVVGVMPESFVFPYRSMLAPSGYTQASTADIWTPMYFTGGFYVDASGQPVRQLRALALIGRLKPGVSADSARSDLAGVASRLAALYPTSNDGWTTTVVPLLDQTVGSLRPALQLLLAGVGILLLMTLANVANLLLAQAMGRQREMALRAALGASRLRLARQAIVESLIVVGCGGVVGALLLYVGVPLIVAGAPMDMPRLGEIRPDAPVFAFALALTVISGVIVGAVPAFLAAGRDASASLKDGARGSTSGPAARRMRAGLVGAEIVLAVLLTSASLLLARSFIAVLDVDPGFRADHLLTFQLSVPTRLSGVPARLAYYDDLFGRLAAIPGVVAAGGTTRLPLGSTNVSTRVAVEGRDVPESALPEVEFRRAVGDYFKAMDIPILRGRDFTPADSVGAPAVCLLNSAAVGRLFAGEDPIGRRLRMGQTWLTIVGVIGDVRHSSLEEAPKPELYISSRQGPPSSPFVVVRTTGDPLSLAEPVRQAVASIDPLTPIWEMKSMSEIRRQSMSERRFLLTLVGLFGALALALAAIGVYGAMAVLVSERRTEVGVRLALGSTPAAIFRLVLSRAGALAVGGIALGLLLTFIAAPLMARSLFGVAPRDLVALATTPAVLIVIALVAAIIPARRAMRVDPIVTLRSDA